MFKKYNLSDPAQFREATSRINELSGLMGDMAQKLEGDQSREDYTDDEKKQLDDYKREYEYIKAQVERENISAFARSVAERAQPKTAAASIREQIREAVKAHESREITLSPSSSTAKNNIGAASAQNVTVKDIMPELNEGLVFGKVGMQVQTGVRGEIIWPYATDSVEFEEVGEGQELTDQPINFDKITVKPARVGATVRISNEAIDDASFDLMGYVQNALTLAQQRYLNWKTFSVGTGFDGIHGPWSNVTTIPTTEATYAGVLAAKADLIESGVDMTGFCYVLDAQTEARLKATPKAQGQGGFVIEDGKLDGDPYFVAHFIHVGRKDKDANAAAGKKLDKKGDKISGMYLGLGAWGYFAANQHGEVRVTVDPVTEAKKNNTVITVNTKWSLTTLRPEAFAVYQLTEPAVTAQTVAVSGIGGTVSTKEVQA